MYKMDVTIRTKTLNKEERKVTLWLNPDNTVSLLGGLLHNTTIIIDQKLISDLQKLFNAMKTN